MSLISTPANTTSNPQRSNAGEQTSKPPVNSRIGSKIYYRLNHVLELLMKIIKSKLTVPFLFGKCLKDMKFHDLHSIFIDHTTLPIAGSLLLPSPVSTCPAYLFWNDLFPFTPTVKSYQLKLLSSFTSTDDSLLIVFFCKGVL